MLQLDGQVKPSSNVQTQASVQTLQPVAAAPNGIAPMGTLARSQFHWYHAVFAVGLLAASGAGTAVLIKVYCCITQKNAISIISYLAIYGICYMLMSIPTSYSIAISSSC